MKPPPLPPPVEPHAHQPTPTKSVWRLLFVTGLVKGQCLRHTFTPRSHQPLLAMLLPSQHPASVTPAEASPQLLESHCHLAELETARGKRRTLSSAVSTRLRTGLGCLAFTSSTGDIANNRSYLCRGGFVLFFLHTGLTLGNKSHGQDSGRGKGTSPPSGTCRN